MVLPLALLVKIGDECAQEVNSIGQTVGERIQKLRKSKGYSRQTFSKIVGLFTNYLSDVERGKSFAGLDRLVLMTNALECSADDIFGDVIKTDYKVKSSWLSERIELFSPDDEKEQMFAVLDTLIGQSEKIILF